jgi:NADPH-dependent 2,4-dienoyl-CoA reductase/sulfur reductase-like enzyme
VQAFDGRHLTLDDGTTIAGDFVVVGIGVKPRTELAQKAGLAVRDGVLVDEFLQTSVAHVFAAGDVARFPRGADSRRIEHWVVAQRQGQVAAANMLGLHQRYDAVPFFWTHHYDLELRYVGHAESWDEIRVDGSIAQRNCTTRFLRNGLLLAAACIGRDLESLQIEAELHSAMAVA